jgi:hypothetical protein
LEHEAMMMPRDLYTSDAQKGQWGGHPRRNDRELTAEVIPVLDSQSEHRYRIKLAVRSTDASRPLLGTVRFHLHPAFETPQEVAVGKGVARLELLSSGVFTVGAEADGGRTKLELDLAAVGGIHEDARR